MSSQPQPTEKGGGSFFIFIVGAVAVVAVIFGPATVVRGILETASAALEMVDPATATLQHWSLTVASNTGWEFREWTTFQVNASIAHDGRGEVAVPSRLVDIELGGGDIAELTLPHSYPGLRSPYTLNADSNLSATFQLAPGYHSLRLETSAEDAVRGFPSGASSIVVGSPAFPDLRVEVLECASYASVTLAVSGKNAGDATALVAPLVSVQEESARASHSFLVVGPEKWVKPGHRYTATFDATVSGGCDPDETVVGTVRLRERTPGATSDLPDRGFVEFRALPPR